MTKRCIIVLLSTVFAVASLPAAIAQDWIYHTRQGDTLWDLCIEYSNKRGCWIELGKYNQIADDKAIPVGTEIRFPQDWLMTPPTVGQVLSVDGEVWYQGPVTGNRERLLVGQYLLLGSRIVTGQGSAMITLGEHSSLLVRPDSELVIDRVSSGAQAGQSTELSLERGEVDVTVESDSGSRFEIKTPSATAAVRGTVFRVSSQEGGQAATRSEVIEGSVEVSATSAVLVPAGYGVKVEQGEAPGQLRELLPPPVFDDKKVHTWLPINVGWQSGPQAVAWHLDLRQRGKLVDSQHLSEPRVVLSGLAEGCYGLSVRAIDADGFNGLEASLPVCVVAAATRD